MHIKTKGLSPSNKMVKEISSLLDRLQGIKSKDMQKMIESVTISSVTSLDDDRLALDFQIGSLNFRLYVIQSVDKILLIGNEYLKVDYLPISLSHILFAYFSANEVERHVQQDKARELVEKLLREKKIYERDLQVKDSGHKTALLLALISGFASIAFLAKLLRLW